jgi:hypothetical protein
MCLTRRRAIVMKNTIANATHTTAISRSIGHSSSAYSLDCVMPRGKVMAASTIMACQPQNVNAASNGLPAPERECSQLVEGKTDMAGALHDVVGGREQPRAAEGKDHCVGCTT